MKFQLVAPELPPDGCCNMHVKRGIVASQMRGANMPGSMRLTDGVLVLCDLSGRRGCDLGPRLRKTRRESGIRMIFEVVSRSGVDSSPWPSWV